MNDDRPLSECNDPACGCHAHNAVRCGLSAAVAGSVPLPEAALEGVKAVRPATAAPGAELRIFTMDELRAEGATAERARIRQMALDRAEELDGVAGEGDISEALRDFAALLEKP